METVMKLIRTATILVTAFILTACGFKPMHAPTAFGDKGVSMKNIAVEMQANEKIDFLLAQALRDRMGDNNGTPYILRITPGSSRKNLGIGADDVASRYDLVMETEFELVDAKTGDVVYSNKTRAVSTYGAPRDPYGTIAAQANAEEQVAAESADRIIAKLASYQASTDNK
jgi:LPS-assembly lipoprotein